MNYDRAYSLIQFLRSGETHMEMSYPFEKKFAIFCEFRYELLGIHYPHKTFSVSQCSFDFFSDTLAYLEGKVEIPKKESGNTYVNNYIDWLIEWKKQIDA